MGEKKGGAERGGGEGSRRAPFREQNRASGKKLQSGQRRERVGFWKPSIPSFTNLRLALEEALFFRRGSFEEKGGRRTIFFLGGKRGGLEEKKERRPISEPSRTIEKSGSQCSG